MKELIKLKKDIKEDEKTKPVLSYSNQKQLMKNN